MPTKRSDPLGVTADQISAAQTMWRSLPEDWHYADQVLAMAKQAFPSNTDRDSAWLKVPLLDSLYRTNVHFYLSHVVNRVVEVFGKMSNHTSQDIVVELAKEVQVKKKSYRPMVFASKYVHFFHDDSSPMIDWYAAFALACHFRELKPEARIKKWKENYYGYCDAIDQLKEMSAISPTARDLDHYLWLAGNWVWFKKKGQKAKINKGLLAFFSLELNVVRANATFGALLG